jgi:hypothetical protein
MDGRYLHGWEDELVAVSNRRTQMGAPDRLAERAEEPWAMTPMIPPTIPVGTSREVLISHHLQVLQKLDEAKNAMASIQPNGLDYIIAPQYGPSGPTHEVFDLVPPHGVSVST